MVTMATQRLSEFALHVRAILGLPIPTDADGWVPLTAPGASAVLLATGTSEAPTIHGLDAALATDPSVDVRLFGKPDARPGRRMGVALATGRMRIRPARPPATRRRSCASSSAGTYRDRRHPIWGTTVGIVPRSARTVDWMGGSSFPTPPAA